MNVKNKVIVTSAIVIGVIAISIGCLFIIPSSSNTIENTSIAGLNVSGMTVKQAKTALQHQRITVSVGSQHHTYTLHDLGITANIDSTVKQASERRSIGQSFINRRVDIPVTIDSENMTAKLNMDFLGDQAVQQASASFSGNTNDYTLVTGKNGSSIDVDPIIQAMVKNGKLDNITTSVTTTRKDDVQPSAHDDLNKTIERANTILRRSYIIQTNTGSETIPTSVIASMMTIDNQSKDIVWNNDVAKSAFDQYVKGLGLEATPTVNMMTPDGSAKIATITYGSNGKELLVPDDSVSVIMNAMKKGIDAQITAEWKIIDSPVTKKNAPGDFTSANGSPWIQVNLSEQRVYAYKGSTLVNTLNAATGKGGQADKTTDNGVFYVNVKYTTQTMRGADYVTPNVPWISYFNGGEGFHGAPWNTYNIAHGISSSHGCINMNVNDAKWIYDFAPIGTKVDVVGTTPVGSTR